MCVVPTVSLAYSRNQHRKLPVYRVELEYRLLAGLVLLLLEYPLQAAPQLPKILIIEYYYLLEMLRIEHP